MGKLKREMLRKRKDKYQKRALAMWRPILQEYDLRVGDSFLHYAAVQYGWAKAEGGFLGFLANLMFENPLQQIMIAAAIVISFVTLGTATVVTTAMIISAISSIISAVAYVATVAYGTKIYTDALKKYSYESSTKAIENLKNIENARGKESETITDLIINGGYAIYANGTIYLDGLAGVNSGFCSQIAPDVSKGQYGNLQDSPLDERINNRIQTTWAGGVSYMNETLKNGQPQAIAIGEQENTKIIKEAYVARALKTGKGFSALMSASFGLNTYDGFLTNAYKELESATVDPYKVYLCTCDFLYKNKAYNRGELRDFDVLDLSDFKQTKLSEITEIKEEIENYYSEYKAFQNDTSLTIDKKADYYVDNVEWLFNKILDGNYYEILEITDENKNKADYIFKKDDFIGFKGELVDLKTATEIVQKMEIAFANFNDFLAWVKYCLSQTHGQKCEYLDPETDEYHWSDLKNFFIIEFLEYKFFCFFDDETLKILQQFKNDIPKNPAITDELINQNYSGVG